MRSEFARQLVAEQRDEELLLAAGRGDRQAFGRLVERHHRAVVQFIYRFLGGVDRDSVEDLAQDVFLKAWKGARGYRPRAKASTWLLQIARNTSLNYRRSRRLRRTLPLDEGDAQDQAIPDLVTDETGVSERTRQVQAAIAGLPDKQRAATILRHYQDLSYSDIAVVLGVSVSAVESLLFRARRALREGLAVREADLNSPQVSPELRAEPKREGRVL